MGAYYGPLVITLGLKGLTVEYFKYLPMSSWKKQQKSQKIQTNQNNNERTLTQKSPAAILSRLTNI